MPVCDIPLHNQLSPTELHPTEHRNATTPAQRRKGDARIQILEFKIFHEIQYESVAKTVIIL